MAEQKTWHPTRNILHNPSESKGYEEESNHDTAALLSLSAQGASTVNGADQANINGRGVQVVVDVTAITGTSPTVTVKIQGKDKASGKYYDLLASAALTAVGTTLLTLYPGATDTVNVSKSTPLPAAWRVIATVGGTTPSVTATVGASVIN